MTNSAFIDIHVLQTVPPSNLNRDDAGTPKQAVYGGARRSRVSSQAWKRATRMAFAESIPEADRATRTKRFSTLVADRLRQRTGLEEEQAQRIGTGLLKALKITLDRGGRKVDDSSYLLFLGRRQLDGIADLVAGRAAELATLDDKEMEAQLDVAAVRELLVTGHPVDVALFGRMVADVPALNVDAACQVAHAISTHPVEVEFDYYTAVDDENPDEETGAGMIGTVEFNSATLYRYATVAFPQLLENLGDDCEAALDALDAFIDGFVRSMPTGKQNSFAHRTLPGLVGVCVRKDQPVNLVSAFEEPVHSLHGISHASGERLAKELLDANELWSAPAAFVAGTYRLDEAESGEMLEGAFGASVPFPQLRASVVEHVRSMASSGVS